MYMLIHVYPPVYLYIVKIPNYNHKIQKMFKISSSFRAKQRNMGKVQFLFFRRFGSNEKTHILGRGLRTSQ